MQVICLKLFIIGFLYLCYFQKKTKKGGIFIIEIGIVKIDFPKKIKFYEKGQKDARFKNNFK